MKTLILIIGTVVLSTLNTRATNKTSTFSTVIITEAISDNDLVKVYDWNVETNSAVYSGTSLSIEHAKEMIRLTSSGELINGSKIESYFVLKTEAKDNSKRNYFWEVETATGFAKGYSSTEGYAHKMIQLVSSGDAIVSKKIISQLQQ